MLIRLLDLTVDLGCPRQIFLAIASGTNSRTCLFWKITDFLRGFKIRSKAPAIDYQVYEKHLSRFQLCQSYCS